MAGLLSSNKLTTIPDYGLLSATALDELKQFGQAYIYQEIIPGQTEGYVFCFPNNIKNSAIQLFITYNGATWLKRAYIWDSSHWSAWSAL